MRRASVRQKCRINRKADGEEGQPNLMISPCFLDLIAPLLGRSACHLPELYVHSQMLRTQIVRLNSACHTMIVYKSWNVNQTSKKEEVAQTSESPTKSNEKNIVFWSTTIAVKKNAQRAQHRPPKVTCRTNFTQKFAHYLWSTRSNKPSGITAAMSTSLDPIPSSWQEHCKRAFCGTPGRG